MRKVAKRKSTKKPSAEEQPRQSPTQPAEDNHFEETKENGEPEPSVKASATDRRKRASSSRPEAEPEYFPEQRNLEDLWKQVFPVGTEWDHLDTVYQYKWNFSNLEEALEEGGELYNRKVYLFGCTEAESVSFLGQDKVILLPAVVAVVSPLPPSDKVGIASVQREEKIVLMKQMKMDWVPYIPLEKRGSQVERLRQSQIFILSCTQRRAGLKQLKLERLKTFDYCIPYFYNPLKEDEMEHSTEVPIMFPLDSKNTDSDSEGHDSKFEEEDSNGGGSKLVVCQFDWEFDEVEEFTDKLIEEEHLPADKKFSFKDYVKKKVQKAKKAIREAKEARRKAREEMSEETRSAFQNMKFYKFYPVSTPDTPTFRKSAFINRYYGNAHKVI